MTNELVSTLDHSDEKTYPDQVVISVQSTDGQLSLNNSEKSNVAEEKVQLSEDEIGLSTLSTEQEEQDGGYGWFVVLGAFLVQVTSFGTSNSVMQNYYEQNLFSYVTNAAVKLSFVGTLASICLNACSPIIQICVSYFGVRYVLIIGTLLVSLGLEMAGFSTQIWHLYLTQGVAFGIGSSCIYVCILTCAPQWFVKRRGLALGIVASGSGIGGLIIPFIMTPINERFGPAWTYRILGFICLACNTIACFTVKQRIPTDAQKRKKFSQIIQFSVLKNTNFVLFMLASDVALFAYTVPYYFIPSYATYLGLSETQGSSIIAVTSACNFVGRILAGLSADRLGKVNTNLLFTFVASLACLLVWTLATSFGGLMAFAAVYGLTSGSFYALLSPITAHLINMDQFPSGISFLLVTNIITGFGANIASAVEAGVHSSPYFSYKMFTGVAYLLASIILLTLKLRLNRSILSKV